MAEIGELKKKEEELVGRIRKMGEDYEVEKVGLNESIGKMSKKYEMVKNDKDLL